MLVLVATRIRMHVRTAMGVLVHQVTVTMTIAVQRYVGGRSCHPPERTQPT